MAYNQKHFSKRKLEFKMRDAMGVLEEISSKALFAMNSCDLEIISIQPAAQRQASTSYEQLTLKVVHSA